MASMSVSPLRLGLVAPPALRDGPPLAILAERAGWDSLWLPEDRWSPAPSDTGVIRAGRIIEHGAVTSGSTDPVWLRGPAAADRVATWSAMRPRPAGISADAVDTDAANAIQSAGAIPVFGPAPLQELLSLLGSFGGPAAVYLPASPGRTEAESHARLDADPELRLEALRAPGLTGTLDHCQRTVAALYLAGLRELRLRVPATPDVADVIAQVSALRAEALARLEPGSPRSPAPAAPGGWGGRQ
jgi:hypothetical protein